MGKRGGRGRSKGPQSTQELVSQNSVSIREEITGKLQTKGGSRNPRSFLRLEHLRNLAHWTTKEVSIPSLGAFFGRQAAAAAEVLAAPPDPNVVSCQRCETILQPGFNCTVRVEKIKRNASKKSKKGHNALKNNVVYKCHYCSHFNRKRGTARGYVQSLCSPKQKAAAKREQDKHILQDTSENVPDTNQTALPVTSENVTHSDAPATPAMASGSLLLEAKKRRRKSGTKRASVDSEGTATTASQKKRRKSWTSLKQMVESARKETLPIPFII